MTAKRLLSQLADRGIRFVLHRNRVSLQLTSVPPQGSWTVV